MNEDQVRELLRSHDQHIVVGSPPHAAIVALARHRRRRARAVAISSAALATAAVVSVAAIQHAFGTTSGSPDHHVVATQAPTPDNPDAPTADAAFQGTWQVISMATFDPDHPHENEGITSKYVHPQDLSLTLTGTTWRADVPCGYMSGRIHHDGADMEHQDPVHADMDACARNTAIDPRLGIPHHPGIHSEYGATVNLADLMLRVRQWSLVDGELHLHSQSRQIIVALKPAG